MAARSSLGDPRLVVIASKEAWLAGVVLVQRGNTFKISTLRACARVVANFEMVFAISHWSTDCYDSVASRRPSTVPPRQRRLPNLGCLACSQRPFCRSDTRRLLVSPKVARAMRWRRSERDRGHFRPTPIFAVSVKFEERTARTRLRSRVTPILS